jgi:hypothetical protein
MLAALETNEQVSLTESDRPLPFKKNPPCSLNSLHPGSIKLLPSGRKRERKKKYRFVL